MRCLVVDVTDEGGKRDVAYIAFVRYAFEGISEEDIDKGYPDSSGTIHSMHGSFFQGIYIIVLVSR